MKNTSEVKEEFLSVCREKIHREGIEDMIKWLEKSDFFVAPASTRFHGNYEGGLAEHSINVYKCLKDIATLYPDDRISDENIAVVALFHDICKVNFYKKGFRNVKDDSTGQWYKKEVYEIDEKFPMGHGEKSCIILQWFLKKLDMQELLAIRWHMGGFDVAVQGGEYGMNNAYEKCRLAPMLHIADMMATYLEDGKTCV